MFIAGINFTLPYYTLKFQFNKIFGNEEFKAYAFITLSIALIIGFGLFNTGNYSIENSIRLSLFQVVSILTTTGFFTASYLLWPTFLIALIFTLMFIGSSSGSTGGGVKVIRIVLILKNCYFELKRLIHPKAIIPIRINEKTVPQPILNNVISFIVFYLLIFTVGSILMAFVGLDVQSSMGSVAASLGNIGPGIGSVGPGLNYSLVSQTGKWILSTLMLLGRLELFTILVLFALAFWKK
jgi:trk system potassium uptake protein